MKIARRWLVLLALTVVLTAALAGAAWAAVPWVNLSPYFYYPPDVWGLESGDGAPELAEPPDGLYWVTTLLAPAQPYTFFRHGTLAGYWRWMNNNVPNVPSGADPPLSPSTNPAHNDFYSVRGVAEYAFAQLDEGYSMPGVYPLRYQGSGVWSRSFFVGAGGGPSEWAGCSVTLAMTGQTGYMVLDQSIPKISPSDLVRSRTSPEGPAYLDYTKAYPYLFEGDLPYPSGVMSSLPVTVTAAWSGTGCTPFPTGLERVATEWDAIGQLSSSPTAVTLSGFEASSGLGDILGHAISYVAGGLAASVGASCWLAIRRRKRGPR